MDKKNNYVNAIDVSLGTKVKLSGRTCYIDGFFHGDVILSTNGHIFSVPSHTKVLIIKE